MGTPHASPATLRSLLLLLSAAAFVAPAAAAAAMGHPVPVAHLQANHIYGSQHSLGKIDGDSGNLTHPSLGDGKGASQDKGSLDPLLLASSFADLLRTPLSDEGNANGTLVGASGLNTIDPKEGSAAQGEEEGKDGFGVEDEQWGGLASSMDEYSAELVAVTGELEQKTAWWVDAAQEWAEETKDMHPYLSPSSASPTNLTSDSEDVSSYASAMSAFARGVAASAADVARQAGEFRSFAVSVRGEDLADWFVADDYWWYTNSLGDSLSHLASWTAELARAAASWHENVAFLSAQQLDTTGLAPALEEYAQYLQKAAGDVDELALSWSSYARDMNAWVSEWREYAVPTELL